MLSYTEVGARASFCIVVKMCCSKDVLMVAGDGRSAHVSRWENIDMDIR